MSPIRSAEKAVVPADIQAALAAWRAKNGTRLTAVDAGGGWQADDYRRLFWSGRDGWRAYYATVHWRQTRARQLEIAPNCEEGEACRGGWGAVQVHHVHYQTLGEEAPGRDLLTLVCVTGTSTLNASST